MLARIPQGRNPFGTAGQECRTDARPLDCDLPGFPGDSVKWFTHPAWGESLSVIVVKPFGGDRGQVVEVLVRSLRVEEVDPFEGADLDVKPCAGQPHARIERGMRKRAGDGTAPLTTNE